jgi:hypothetical protein
MKVQLLDICHARSGDKGDAANVGLIAREEHYYPVIKQFVTKAAVKRHFKGICNGPVDRYELPNLWALNFLLHNTLGGGGTVSLTQARRTREDTCGGTAPNGDRRTCIIVESEGFYEEHIGKKRISFTWVHSQNFYEKEACSKVRHRFVPRYFVAVSRCLPAPTILHLRTIRSLSSKAR